MIRSITDGPRKHRYSRLRLGMTCFQRPALTLYAEADQGGEDHQEREDFAPDILLLEAENAIDKRHHKAPAIEDQRDEYHHSSFLLQSGQINDVGNGDENSHRHNAPTPLERLFFPLREPNEPVQHCHYQKVVNGVPCLDGGGRDVLLTEQELVKHAAQGHQNSRGEQHIHPLVRLELYALQLARTVHEIEGYESQDHAYPLKPSQAFPKDEKHQDDRDGRPELIDRPNNGDGQVLHRRITEHPRTNDDGSLAHDQKVLSRRNRLDEQFRHEIAGEKLWLRER